MGHWLQRAIALLLCGLAAVCVSPAHAQDDAAHANPKALFERGVAHYAAGQYASALNDFQEAFRVRPHPLVNVNIANCYDKLGKPMEALFHFQRFLDSDAGTPAQREEVKAAVERLKQQVGKVQLRVTPDGALAVFDHGEQRKAPLLDAVSLDAGQHTLEVRLSGYKTVERTLSVRGGVTLEVNIALERETAAVAAEPALTITPATEAPTAAQPNTPTAAEPEPTAAPAATPETAPAQHADAERPRRSATPLPTRVWIVGGIGVGLVVVATITGLLALDANSDFEAARSTRFDETATGLQRLASYNVARDAASRADALALTTDIMLGGAVISAGITIYMIANARSQDHKPATTQLTPLLSPHLAGLQLRTQL